MERQQLGLQRNRCVLYKGKLTRKDPVMEHKLALADNAHKAMVS